MMYFPPFFNFSPYYPKYYKRSPYIPPVKVPVTPYPEKTFKKTSLQAPLSTIEEENRKAPHTINKEAEETAPLFEIFGLKLYFDDILLLGLIFFLYSEGVDDINLYIALVLLLLS